MTINVKIMIGLIIAISSIWAAHCLAMDVVKMSTSHAHTSSGVAYKEEVLRQALTLTRAAYGDYQMTHLAPPMTRSRAFNSVQQGLLTNLHMIPETQNWEAKTIPIKIPLRRGIISYRLLLTHQKKLSLFTGNLDIPRLKIFSLGVQAGTSTAKIFTEQGFNTTQQSEFDRLFPMLEMQRFDYMLRGVHEVYRELETVHDQAPSLTVVPDFYLYSHLPTYTYVSKLYPRLAERVNIGLRTMVANGDLKRIFYRYYGTSIVKAKISERKEILLGKKPMINDDVKDAWFTPGEKAL